MADKSFLGWPFFDEGHRNLADELESWSTEHLPALLHGSEDDPDSVDQCVRRIVEELGRCKLLRVCVPGAYGGTREQLDVRCLSLAREILARQSGLADFALAMQGLGSAPISLFGNEHQKSSILPRVAAGTALAAFALSEPDAGSDVSAISTTARCDGKYWRLDGAKTWISNAGLAAFYVVFARTGEGPGTKGLSAFIVEAGSPGLDASERIDVMAPHPLGTVRLRDCRVPAESLLGRAGEGFKIAMATLDVFRTTVGAAALGFARRAMDEAVARASERRMFGRSQSEFQLTQEKLADMAVSIDAAALLVYRSAWIKDSMGSRVTREAAMAKLYATEAAQEVIDAAVQIFGGMGVVRGVPVERLYREIRALRIYEGASEVLKLIIGAKVLESAKPGTASRSAS
ncbi:MAG: acyl-CoA dehydrogenase family protein [Acidobacteriota bacterium]|nr:acyl-CoA dehydrogenase family protein [Acidobacteriota bacterium]